MGKMGNLYVERHLGTITLDRDRCRGRRTCWNICPVAVFGEVDADNKTTFRDPSALTPPDEITEVAKPLEPGDVERQGSPQLRFPRIADFSRS